MNDLLPPCESWIERISLAAAGCLSPDEEQETRRHLETCAACRARFEQLTGLCGELSQANWPANSAESVIVERVMSAVAADQRRRSIAGTWTEMIHPMLLTIFLTPWRWIMRSPVSRLSAAAVFALAVTGVALWFQGGGAKSAFADFVATILEAKTAKFKVTSEFKGPPAIALTGEVMVLDGTRSRQETEMWMSDKPKTEESTQKMVMISDWRQGKSLGLDPATKKATVTTLTNLTKEQIARQDMFAQFRSMLLDAKDKEDVKRESLGEKDIDGRHVVGFRITSKGSVTSLWGDPKTGMPVRAETTMAMFPNVKVIMSDFVFNVAMDESLFSVEPPAGYTVENVSIDVSPAEEKDLIMAFREYRQLSGGVFPDSFDFPTMIKAVKEARTRLATEAAGEKPAPGKEEPSKEQMQKVTDTLLQIQRGLQFALMLPAEADAHYAGKGVSFGAADKPIFWYRPKDAKKYRVIYADLSVCDSDTPPKVSDAQSMPSVPGAK